jgi:hypothetical protein
VVPPAAPPGDLARGIKLELARLGCAAGDIDDNWNSRAKDAVRKFNRYAKAKLGLEQPTPELMAALRGHEERVCPLECGPGTRARGDVCVAIDRVEQPKSRKAEPPRERKRPVASRTPAERPAGSPKPPASPKSAGESKSEFASPLCQSRIQNAAGNWCCTYDPPRGPSIIICR